MNKENFTSTSAGPSASSGPVSPNGNSLPEPKPAARNKTLRLTQLAMLSAIIIAMAFTPLGYLKVGPLSITFLTIPVVLGAILMGPIDGAILGAVFGATSFAQCFLGDPFGAALVALNPFYTFLICLVPRILIGIISGYLSKGLLKTRINQVVTYAVSALAGSLTNTVFFVGLLILFFGNSALLRSFGNSVLEIIGVLVTVNSLVEAVVCTVLVTILAKTLVIVLKRMRR